MKEIIYLNTDIMNSLLAQLDEGIVNSFSHESNNEFNEGEEVLTARGKNAGINGKVSINTGIFPGGSANLGGSLGNNRNDSEKYSRDFLEGQKDILNKAFHDYALDLLEQKLYENELLTTNSHNLIEGDLYLGESPYRFYDFNLIANALDHQALEKFMLLETDSLKMDYKTAEKLTKKSNPSSREREQLQTARQVVEIHETTKGVMETFKNLNALGSYASKLLEGLTIVKVNDQIGLLKKEYLRESVESLSFRTNNQRKIKYLVRVIGKKDVVYDGFGIEFQMNDLDLIPSMLLDIVLGSFDIIETGDLLVNPIALYYE